MCVCVYWQEKQTYFNIIATIDNSIKVQIWKKDEWKNERETENERNIFIKMIKYAQEKSK